MEAVKLPLPAFPSPISSNLVASETQIAYATNSPQPKIHIIPQSSVQAQDLDHTVARYEGPNAIYHINYIQVGGEWHLMLGTDTVMQAWNEDGTQLRAHFSQDDMNNAPSEVYFSASAGHGNMIVIGSSVYALHFLYRRADQFNTIYEKIPDWECKHSGPVSVIAADDNYIISGDELGAVCIWKQQDPERWGVAHKFNSFGINATSIGKLTPSHLVAVGFGQGMFKVYNTEQCYMLYQIGSHAKWLSALAVRGTMVATWGEDSTINVWNVTEDSATVVKSQRIDNTLLYGLLFVGNNLVSLSYDSDKLHLVNLN